MTAQQLILSLVLATMVFSVALELKIDDFRRVAQTPRAVVCGLIPQFILLPVGTWAATMVLDLPPNVEAAMILVASCPGGSLSNVITHFGRGNTALSVSVSRGPVTCCVSSASAAIGALWSASSATRKTVGSTQRRFR